VWTPANGLLRWQVSSELGEMPALMCEVVLNEKAERDGSVVADDATCFEPVFWNVVDYGGQDLVLYLPPEQQSVPRLVGIAVSGNPCFLGILRPGIVAIRGGADEALAVVGG